MEFIADISIITIPLGFIALEVFYYMKNRNNKKYKEFDKTLYSDDYTIIVPLWGKISILAEETLQVLLENKKHAVILTTTNNSIEFYTDLKRLGLKYIEFDNIPNPNPWTLFINYFRSVYNETKYTILLDADSYPIDSFTAIVGNAIKYNYDIASTNIVLHNNSNTIEYLQNVEYTNAMISRRTYPWMTSGACVIGKTMALRQIFMSHSLFTQGGDLEIGKKAMSYGMEVGHIPAIIKTYAPSTVKKWFRQRTFWMCGTFRHTIMNMKFEIWRFPFYFIYAVVVVYLMFPFRLYEIFLHPTKLLIIIPIYWMIIFAMNWRLRSWKMLLTPLYDLTQILIIVPVGAIRYFIFARKYKNMGIINDNRNNYIK